MTTSQFEALANLNPRSFTVDEIQRILGGPRFLIKLVLWTQIRRGLVERIGPGLYTYTDEPLDSNPEE